MPVIYYRNFRKSQQRQPTYSKYPYQVHEAVHRLLYSFLSDTLPEEASADYPVLSDQIKSSDFLYLQHSHIASVLYNLRHILFHIRIGYDRLHIPLRFLYMQSLSTYPYYFPRSDRRSCNLHILRQVHGKCHHHSQPEPSQHLHMEYLLFRCF